jgi:exosortase
MSRLIAISLLFCWFQFFNQMRVIWSAREQYAYGWFVPLLAAALLWQRWKDRPAPQVATQKPEVGGPWSVVCTPWSVFFLLVLLLLFRVLEAANLNWNLLYWIHALTLLGMSLGALRLCAGQPALRHYSFPLFFILTSLAWPTRIDEWVTQGLMRQVAGATVEVVGLFGIPALQHGNVVEISNGRVGIDDACSGIRSLQSSIMLALLLGELFRLRWWRRALLLPSGILLAIVANLGRTSFLTWNAAKQGLERMHAWHDPAGIAVVGVVMGGLALLALLWRGHPAAPAPALHGQDPEVRGPWPVVRGPWSVVRGLSPRPLPAGFLVLCCLWVPLTEGLTWAWYHWPGKGPVAAVPWSIRWPTNEGNFAQAHLTKGTADQLRCTENAGASWTDQYGNQWDCVSLYWAPVHNLDMYVGGHNPENCLTAVGSTFLGKVAPVTITSGSFSMRFEHRLFEREHRLFHVFQGTWEPFPPPSGQRQFRDSSLKARLNNALQRRLICGGTTLEFSLAGPATEQEAKTLFEQQVPRLILPHNTSLQFSNHRMDGGASNLGGPRTGRPVE